MAMETNAGCAFVTNSLSLSRVLDIFESLPEVCINREVIFEFVDG